MRYSIWPSSRRASFNFGSSASARSNSSRASASRFSSAAARPAPRCSRGFFGSAARALRNASAAACACPAFSAVHASRSTSAVRGSTCARATAGAAERIAAATSVASARLRFMNASRIMRLPAACRPLSPMSVSADDPVVVIGAGPAGLTAAYVLTGRGVPTIVFDGDTQVGGLAKTIVYKGFRFDIGGHRFFTKVPAVQALWRDLLGDDLLRRPRLSRIYYGGRFFDYPLK